MSKRGSGRSVLISFEQESNNAFFKSADMPVNIKPSDHIDRYLYEDGKLNAVTDEQIGLFSRTMVLTQNQLRVTFEVKFVTKGYSTSVDNKLRSEFKKIWVDKEDRWDYDSANQTFTYSY